MRWVQEFAATAVATDRLVDHPDHTRLLAAGLFGEVGSVVAEVKKQQRERDSYPERQSRMLEELGDALWYLTRLSSLVAPELLDADCHAMTRGEALATLLDLGTSAGEVLAALAEPSSQSLVVAFRRVWAALRAAADAVGVELGDAARANCSKIRSRWPTERHLTPLFDDAFPAYEQLPRALTVEFVEQGAGERKNVLLRCNDLNFGDRLTDNSPDPDGYRFHDIFHFSNAVHLGWSPVVRALLRCKRKSDPRVDEAEDGQRAVILDEAIAATVFSRAKQLRFFEGIDHIDYDLLKTVSGFIEGYEVSRVPLWQWEMGILDGYRVFRLLRANGGGRVQLDLVRRTLGYERLA